MKQGTVGNLSPPSFSTSCSGYSTVGETMFTSYLRNFRNIAYINIYKGNSHQNSPYYSITSGINEYVTYGGIKKSFSFPIYFVSANKTGG
jgi:hypothetical protein